ncbi:hypothetical protein M409DRAFT_19726 [Zasmidium cellare ATCC 36951]|uniref:Uncharacterized protein n=1 Tax=Zasmidium cellare ATCC 36951 TaxID=1080233 RepID=A0A6A6CV91_ZASCE|nr:uncharacterized protein M409DRAFT_19726 [Zasmidium cellare ATCC 36951]KAF2170120.1 hypothetical protein M409DRAFT_19726 [Zasmidium cellare ATCC 36951]
MAAPLDVDVSSFAAAFNPPPPHHHREPQLTLHDYHKLQQSPLSASPDFDTRRVRRKPSVANLAVTPAQAGSPWPSISTSPHFIHSFAPHPLLLSSLPPPPATPRPRPNTASPSLSSTVTTLQSTPTHTPVHRGGSSFEQRRVNERIELTEPIRTKRKFDSLKQAKRLPRRAHGGGSGDNQQSIERDGAIWEVYAAVFEPSAVYQDFASDQPDLSEQSSEQSLLQPAPLFAHQSVPPNATTRTVRFRETEPIADEQDHEVEAAAAAGRADFSTPSARSREEKDTAATSSYSLSKFQFPVAPGQNNWSGTLGHLTEPNSPSSPAVLHYHGTSFDVVNPHASLLLEGHSFETPAEIDGLLDEYFDEKSEDDNMSYNALTGEASQNSLRMGSDSSRHARVLYGDPDSARRHILRVQEDLQSPPKAVVNDSPLAHKNKEFEAPKNGTFAALPAQRVKVKPSTNPFSDSQSISRADPFGNTNDDPPIKHEGPVYQDCRPVVNAPAVDNEESHLSPSTSTKLNSEPLLHQRYTHCSDPFDLTISENGSRPNLMTIEEVLKKDHDAENTPNVVTGADPVSSPFHDDGAVSQATHADQESDPTIKDIIGSYDYTRVPSSPENDGSAQNSPSIEHSRAIVTKGKGKQPMYMLYAQAQNVDLEEVKTPDSAVALIRDFPTPPTPAYTGVKYWSNCSELPTSDRTYGETNHLLNITTAPNATPVADEIPPYVPDEGTNPFRPYWLGDQSSPSQCSSSGTVVYHERNSNVPEQFRFVDDDELKDVHRPLPRSSSIYPFDIIFDNAPGGDNESAWETEVSKSSAALPRNNSCQSEDSYADTSAYGTENRLSAGPDALAQAPQASGKQSRPTEGPERTNFEAPPDAPADKFDHRRDTQKATSLLCDNILIEGMRTKHGSVPNIDKEQRKLDLQELERLRKTNPAAVREASEFLANRSIENVAEIKSKTRAKLQKLVPFRPDYKPENIFSKVKEIGKGTPSNKSVTAASERRLLGTPDSFTGQNNLEWSESLCDFVTVRDGRSPNHWSPFTENATAHALAVPAQPKSTAVSASRTAVDRGHRAEEASNKRSRRPAMNGQVRLHELKLLPPKRNVPPRGRGLTDAELARREPAWTLQPKRFASTPIATNVMTAQSTALQPDIELQPRLGMRGDFARDFDYLAELDVSTRKEVEAYSESWRIFSFLVPGLPFVFWCGGFDWLIRKKFNNRVPGMRPSDKNQSLIIWLPINLIMWAFIATLGVIFVRIFRKDLV